VHLHSAFGTNAASVARQIVIAFDAMGGTLDASLAVKKPRSRKRKHRGNPQGNLDYCDLGSPNKYWLPIDSVCVWFPKPAGWLLVRGVHHPD